MKISEDVIQRIKDENDIVDIISETVRLKRAGRNYIGLCPFHGEKTPSFTVSSEKGIYKCFGCGEAGNSITFLMKTRGLSFLDAIKVLADKANIELHLDEEKGERDNVYDKLYEINKEAARYFYYSLRNNKAGMTYFTNRGITEETIKKFGLGYSVDSWDSIINYLRKKGYSELDMLSAGLIIKNQNGNSYYDRFRNRVMFPVFDYRGRVIGFGGRVLDNSKPKYLNSPETAVFKKGIHLFGLNFAIKNSNHRELIIVEGYMDCIALHQYGIKNVVASLGTALTINQGKLLKKHSDRVIIAYDADAAGQMATLRGLEVLKSVGLEVRVLTVPQGKDPDEFIRNNGKDAFLDLKKDSKTLVEYKILKEKEGMDLSNPDSLILYVNKVLSIIEELHPLEKDIYIKKLSDETNIKEQALYDMMNDKMQKNVKNNEFVNSESEFGQKLYLEPAYLKAERGILKYMLKSREALDMIMTELSENQLILESHKKIYNLILESKDLKEEEKIKFIEWRCDDIESSKEWIGILETKVDLSDEYKSIIFEYIKEINKYQLEENKKELITKIKSYENEGKIKESLELARELVTIQKKISNMQ